MIDPQKRQLEKFVDSARLAVGSRLPFEASKYLQNINRHKKCVDMEAVQVRLDSKFDVYQFEKEIQSDMAIRSNRMEIRQKMADYIEAQVMPVIPFPEYGDIVERLRNARVTGALGIMPEGNRVVAWDEKVNCVRLCPDESREETQRLVKRYGRAIEIMMRRDPSIRLMYHVFTMPNVEPGKLREGQKQIYKKYSNWHRSKWAKKHVVGSFAMIEAPLSKNQDWNVHLNVISLVRGNYDWSRVRADWGWNVHIDDIQGTPESVVSAFCEAVKYSAKHVGEKSEDGKHVVAPGMTDWPPELWHEWYRAGKGFRRSRTYGGLYLTKKREAELGMNRESGESISLAEWIGAVMWDSNGYRVRLKNGVEAARNGVDSIPADNFAACRRARSEPQPRNSGHNFCDPPDLTNRSRCRA